MILIKVFLLALIICAVNGETQEEKLRRELMSEYNPMAFPPRPVQLSVGFGLLHIDMNEKDSTMDVDVWLKMRWNDTRLVWSSENFNDDTLHFRPKAVWIPDMTLYNNAEPLMMENYGSSHVLSYPNGSMLWVPPAHARAYCTMDMTYWPYDTHKCVLKYGSWTHHALRLNIVVGQEEVEIEDMEGNFADDLPRSEWKLLSHDLTREEKMYECCPEAYVTINLELVVERDSRAYGWTVQCPIAALCLLTIVVFLLPPSTGEKIILGSVTLLINFYFLNSVSEMIGNKSNHTPLIVKLLSKQLLITAAGLVVSAVIIRLSKSPHGRPLPDSLKNLLITLAPFLCLSGYADMVNFPSSSANPEDVELTTGQDGSKRSKQNSNNSAWILFAAVVDRICLLVFFVIYIVLMSQFAKVL